MTEKLVRKVCFLHPERDAWLLAWLATQPNESAAIRAALWAYASPAAADPDPILDPALIQQTITEALDLVALRQVVEAAVKSSLLGLAVRPAVSSEEEDDEIDAALDDFNRNLVLG